MIHLANYRQCIIGLSVLLSNYNKQNKKKLNKKKRKVKSLQVNISKNNYNNYSFVLNCRGVILHFLKFVFHMNLEHRSREHRGKCPHFVHICIQSASFQLT